MKDSWKLLVLPALFILVCTIGSCIASWIGTRIFEMGCQRGFSEGYCAGQANNPPRVSEHLMVLRCDLETGETTEHRTEYVVSADTFGPFSERYLVFDDGEITERTIKGDLYAETYGPPGRSIDRVTVTDKEVLVFYRDVSTKPFPN